MVRPADDRAQHAAAEAGRGRQFGISWPVGAAMLSMLLGCAFLSPQIWGLVADRIGGLRTIFAGSVCQLAAMVGFLATESEAGLFTVSAVFGLGFSGIIPV